MFTVLVGVNTSTATMVDSVEFPQNTRNVIPYDPVIPLLGVYLKNS